MKYFAKHLFVKILDEFIFWCITGNMYVKNKHNVSTISEKLKKLATVIVTYENEVRNNEVHMVQAT